MIREVVVSAYAVPILSKLGSISSRSSISYHSSEMSLLRSLAVEQEQPAQLLVLGATCVIVEIRNSFLSVQGCSFPAVPGCCCWGRGHI